MATVYYDVETYSDYNIKRNKGAEGHIRHSSFVVTLYCWAIDGGPVHTYSSYRPATSALVDFHELLEVMAKPDTIVVAHNALFDYQSTLYGSEIEVFPPLSRWRCTLFLGDVARLPSRSKSLSDIGDTLEVESQKQDNTALMEVLRVGTEGIPKMPAHLWDDFCRYGEYDVRTLRDIYQHLHIFGRSHLYEDWSIAMRANLAGVCIDQQLVNNACTVAEEAKEILDQQVSDASNGQVRSAASSQAARLYINSLLGEDEEPIVSVSITSLNALLLRPRLDEQIRSFVKTLIDSRVTTIGRWDTMRLSHIQGRCFNMLVPRGTVTGRWASRGVQLQNMPSRFPWNHPTKIFQCAEIASSEGFDSLRDDRKVPYHHALKALLRTALVAPKGKTFHIADYAQLEERVARWITNDQKALGNYHNKIDPYVAFGSQYLFNKEEISKEERSIAKSAVLALGYGAGHLKFESYCRDAGVIIDKGTFPLEGRQTPYHYVVQIYRTTQEAISGIWAECDNLLQAVWGEYGAEHSFEVGNNTISARNIQNKLIHLTTSWGYENFYWVPRVGTTEVDYEDPITGEPSRFTTNAYSYRGRGRNLNNMYGSKLYEHIVQGSANEIISTALRKIDSRLRAKGPYYGLAIQVHDELVLACDPEDGKWIDKAMEDASENYSGLPLEVESFQSRRFGKENW